jgi:hypothetical protein
MEGNNVRLADARNKHKSEKNGRIRRGRGSGKKGTWKIDYFAAGHDIPWDRMLLPDLRLSN